MPAIKIAFTANKATVPILLNEEFDYERASARILGRDVGRLLTDTSRQIVARVLSQELDQLGATALAMAMIRKEGGYYGDSDSAIALLVEVQKGVSETRRSWMCFDRRV